MTHYLERELYRRVRESGEIFEFLQEGSLDGVWYWDLERPDHEWMSSRFWTTLGYDPEKMDHNPKAWHRIINQDDLKAALSNVTKHLADPTHKYDQYVRYTHKQGHTVWIHCRGIAIRDPDGKPLRMLGAHVDVTRLFRAGQGLERIAMTLETLDTRTVKAQILGLADMVFKGGAGAPRLSKPQVIELLRSSTETFLRNTRHPSLAGKTPAEGAPKGAT